MAHYIKKQKERKENSNDRKEMMQVRRQRNATFKELEFGEGEREQREG